MKRAKKSNLNVDKKGQFKRMRLHSKVKASRSIDLSDFEENADRSFFIKIGQAAAENAVNENKAMQLPITFLLDGWVVRRMPNGEIQKVIEVKASNGIKNRRIPKGTILHVKRPAR